MKRRLLFLLLCCGLVVLAVPEFGLALSFVSGCVEGDGNAKEEVRTPPEFDAIQVEGAFEVVVSAGQETREVVVHVDENLLPYIVTKVHDGRLLVSTSDSVCPKGRMEVRIRCQSLREIVALGSNRVTCSGIDSNEFRFEITGAGQATVAGRVGKLTVEVNGSSTLQADELYADDVDVVAQGASSAIVRAERSLKAFCSGVSRVSYDGNPRLDRAEVSGVGEILHR